MTKELFDTSEQTKVLAVGIITPKNKYLDIESYFEEFLNLIKTNKIKITKEHFITLRSIDPSTFVTKGKLEEIKKLCEEYEIDEIIFSEPISPTQENELYEYLDVLIFDRTRLILEIFEKRAQSAEAKLQTKIAFLEFRKTRVAGRGIEFSQQGGGIGAKGMGETQKEVDLRHINHLLVKLNEDLKKLSKIRFTQRKNRLKNNNFIVSLAGYTNAGKSTLFNALTKSSALAEDKLFATLDTTTREGFIKEKKFLFSDTVGFIQNLPHNLIEAFKSTLDELTYSDLILHVIDISNKNWKSHKEIAENIFEEMGLDKDKIIYILNKSDKLSSIYIETIKWQFPEPYLILSSIDKGDIIKLQEKIFEISEKK